MVYLPGVIGCVEGVACAVAAILGKRQQLEEINFKFPFHL